MYLLNHSSLLELAASGDVTKFISELQQNGNHVIDDVGLWYGSSSSSNNSSKSKLAYEERTPLMIASIYGSISVIKYILSTNNNNIININKASGTDGATALHCAAAGGSVNSVEVVKLLVNAGADVNLTDGNGNKPGDVIARGIKSNIRKGLEMILKGFVVEVVEEVVTGKKEYPVDIPLPDINGELYGSDEFRMYTFKVKPCSRAYTHDWTECPFVHPGENARRRDPKKYNYSCVPCPEFRKGSCGHGDACEYAHGVFESWLHPAQYKTRLCKDEIGCARKVCFFAHRADELRPLYASTGSAIPSPKSGAVSLAELGSMGPISSMSPNQNSSPLAIGCSTPPMSPALSPATGWMNNNLNHLSPPVLQLSGSRLRTALNARDMELQGLRTQQQQRQLMIDNLSTNLYTNVSTPIRKPANIAFESSAAVAQAVMNSRSSAWKQRSQSFINRSPAGAGSGALGAPYSQWGSPDGKLEWGFNGEDNNKFRKSASFVYRNDAQVNVDHQPDVSWVDTMVKDVSSVGVGLYSSSDKQRYGGRVGGGGEKLPQWVEQMLIEQDQLVA